MDIPPLSCFGPARATKSNRVRLTPPIAALVAALVAATLVLGCNDDGDAEEVISSFQGIGISRQPVFATPGTAGTVAFHFLAPKGSTATLSFATKAPDGVPEVLPLAVQPATLGPDSSFGAALSELVYYKVVAQYVLPSAEVLGMSAAQPYLPLPIGAEFTAGDTTRLVTANLQVYLAGHPAHQEAAGRALAATITEPGDSGGTDQELTLKGAVANELPLDKGRYTIGWFSSGGEVDNVRALDTKWKSGKSAGPYNLVLTLRGNNSKEFAMAVKKITLGP